MTSPLGPVDRHRPLISPIAFQFVKADRFQRAELYITRNRKILRARSSNGRAFGRFREPGVSAAYSLRPPARVQPLLRLAARRAQPVGGSLAPIPIPRNPR